MIQSEVGQPVAWQHPVRAKLTAGQPVFAATLATSNLESAALIATLGFDFLWVEMEHSPITLESLRGMVLATRGLPAAIFARVPVNELWTAKRVLDQGVSGVIFPFTSSAQHAQRAAQACKYPPAGLRGSGAGLATSTWPEPVPYYDSADRHVMVVTVIEEACAVECIDDIAATPGLDVLFIGTSDLSFSLGLRGRQNEPKLEAAIERIVAAGQRHNKFLGRPASTSEQVRDYRKQGFQMFQSLTDLGLISLGARHLLESLRSSSTSDQPAIPVKTDQTKPLY
jgi:2-keto-3-deoxy-L-rhamnonate aldolase RhmA